MDISIGTDIIEISRIKESIEKTEGKFCEKVFTNKEIEYCESKNIQKYQHYAARFAAKEAVFKAISTKLKNKYEITWKDIEILNDKNNKPYVSINNEQIIKIKNIDISISHCKEYAVANVICTW
ncbi:MAG: holo-ACP synthase [Clostridia bacterium]|jgi:holo-[acyl-carrier protein] synthase|nr:holo-ACP synthase [Clostridia bacterium]